MSPPNSKPEKNTNAKSEKNSSGDKKGVYKEVIPVSLLRDGSTEAREKVEVEGLSWLLKSNHLLLYTIVSSLSY